MTEQCPWCGSSEVESNSPRTTYSCGSSCYDQRDGTWQQSALCRQREEAWWDDNADNIRALGKEMESDNKGDETLYKKIALMISVENGEKIVSLTEPIKDYRKPAWNVNLNKDECMVLAHALFKECGIRCARKKV